MGTFYQSLRRWFGNVGSTGQQAGVQFGEPFTRTGSTKNPAPDVGIDGALQVSAVWAAVELMADTLASLPLFVYRRKAGADGHKELARDDALFRLLHEDPNRRHTAMEFWQYMAMNFLLRGNAYARLVRSDAGEVIEMIPLSADQVEVEVLRDGSTVYKYSYEGKIFVYAEESIFHWRDKGNGIIGMSRLDYMRNTVGVALDTQRHQQDQYARSGKRPGVFMIDRLLKEEQRAQIRNNYRSLTEGDDDDLLVLELGAKFEPLSLSPADLQLMETRRFTVEEIARWFGVPSALINDTTKTTTWGTGVESLIQGFYKFRLRAVVTLLEQAITRRVLTVNQRRRLVVEFNMDALLRGSIKDRIDIGARAVQNGLMTRDEWRQLENWPKMGGNAAVLTVQSNLLPIEKLGENPPSASGAGDGADLGTDVAQGATDATQDPSAQ